jgi:hypothetical protein
LRFRLSDDHYNKLRNELVNSWKKVQLEEEVVDQRLNDKRSLLLAAIIAVFKTLKANPYGLNLLSSPPLDVEDYLSTNNDGKRLLQFAESCYNLLLKSYPKSIV